MQTAILCSDHQKWLSESAKKLLRSTKSNFPNHVDQHGHHLSFYPICPGYGPLLYSALTPKWPITVRTLCLFRLAQFEWTCHIVKVLIHCIFSSILFNWRYSTYVGAVEKDLPLTEILLDEEDSYPQLTKSWKLNLEHAVG